MIENETCPMCGGPCEVTRYPGTNYLEDYESLVKAETNARLIAAAPDLLAALKAAFDSWYDDPRHFQIREPAWVGMIRAAIAKAEGNEKA